MPKVKTDKEMIEKIVKPYCARQGADALKAISNGTTSFYGFNMYDCIDIQIYCYEKLDEYTEDINKEIFLFMKKSKIHSMGITDTI